MAILYSLLGSAALALFLWWFGGLRHLIRRVKVLRGLHSYRNEVRQVCSTLIVIGRRRGFSINDVFIPLDLAPSDLCAKVQEPTASRPRVFVLLGGPGAGKSTVVKKFVLEELAIGVRRVPFFVRLRDYSGSVPLNIYLSEQLKKHGIPNPEVLVASELTIERSFCVLDGLDEVRPSLRNQVSTRINEFFHQYFTSTRRGTLIVTCRKEAYRALPLDIDAMWEVRPLTDEQIRRFAQKWPPGYPTSKSADTFWRDLVSTPRIHELARSPLLLVGGLMQYTESNLGIPEERIEYLARVAHWLVADWATAQGHPPDLYRAVYPRLLAKIAYTMHKSETSEVPRADAIKLVQQALPSYGFAAADAELVLDSTMTRTGILVRESPAILVFAQFAMQEYYASIDALENLGIAGLCEAAGKSWWREVILLAVAQEKEPTAYLNQLFEVNSVLASSAVAECPAPSLSVRGRAIQCCLDAIDKDHQTAAGAAVALLRKVRADQEIQFVRELESRLGQSTVTGVAAAVGLILATAGTAEATAALARHPAIWDTCLQAAGYLSSSFEDLLVEWITKGDDKQSAHATGLLASRLSHDRMRQLADLLPSLPAGRADHLACRLLLQLEVKDDRGFRAFSGFAEWVRMVSRCVPYIRDVAVYIRLRGRREVERHGSISIVSAALSLRDVGKSLKTVSIEHTLINAFVWSRWRPQWSWCFAAAVALTACWITNKMLVVSVLSLSVLLFLNGGSERHRWIGPFGPSVPLPWFMFGRGFPSGSAISIVVGISLACAWVGRMPSGPVASPEWILILAFAYLVGAIGRMPWSVIEWHRSRIFTFLTLLASCLALGVCVSTYLTNPKVFASLVSPISICGVCYLGVIGIWLHRDWRAVNHAARIAREKYVQ
jgi:hypothetical protein